MVLEKVKVHPNWWELKQELEICKGELEAQEAFVEHLIKKLNMLGDIPNKFEENARKKMTLTTEENLLLIECNYVIKTQAPWTALTSKKDTEIEEIKHLLKDINIKNKSRSQLAYWSLFHILMDIHKVANK